MPLSTSLATIADLSVAKESKLLCVVPSTIDVLNTAADLAHRAGWHVIGSREFIAPSHALASKLLTPAEFLNLCRMSNAARQVHRSVVLSDQLVSPVHAPLFVAQGDRSVFCSSLEVIAATQLGFSLSFLNDLSFEPFTISPPMQPREILGRILQYYQYCDSLGDTWLLRDQQVQRTEEYRFDAARRRLRLYQSVVMLSASDDREMQLQLPLLEQLTKLHRGLLRNDSP